MAQQLSTRDHPRGTRLETAALVISFLMLFGAGLVSARFLTGSWRAVGAPFVGAAVWTLPIAVIVALHRRGVRFPAWWPWVSLPLGLAVWGAVWDAVNPVAPGQLHRAWVCAGTGVMVNVYGLVLTRLVRRRSRPAPPAE